MHFFESGIAAALLAASSAWPLHLGAQPLPTPSAIAASDILSQARQDIPFSSQSGYTAQTLGQHIEVESIPETGIHGTRLANGDTIRIGKVEDPANFGRKALVFQVSPTDPDTSGSKRSELAMEPNIELNKVYWVAFRAFVYDWGRLRPDDESILGMQVHSGDDPRGLSPSLCLCVVDARANFEVISLTYPGSNPTPRTFTKTRHAKRPVRFGRWTDFVFRFRQSITSSGMLQVWMDGEQIVDYTGGLGFNTPGFKDYMKFGYYNWSGLDSSRKILLQAPTLVLDPTGSKYTASDLRAHINK